MMTCYLRNREQMFDTIVGPHGAGGNRTVCGVFGILAAPALVEALSDAVVDRVAHTVELFRQADVDASCDRVQFIVRYVADRISLEWKYGSCSHLQMLSMR